MKLPALRVNLLPDMPRHVMISLAVMGGALFLYAVLFFTLGTARDAAVADNARLQGETAQAQKNLIQSEEDREYVQKNQERYEALLKSDRLVPHTRLIAVRRMQELALARGLTALNYDFTAAGETSVAAATSQTTSGTYHVNVESIKLAVGAPVDGKIYGFLADMAAEFPGAAVVQQIDIARAPVISSEMLDDVSRNKDSGLVKGTAIVLWRTAQANEKKTEPDRK